MEMVEAERTPVSTILNRSDVQALLKGFIDSSITVLKPDLSPAGDVVYPEAEKIMGASSRTVKEILGALAVEEILVEELSTVIVVCPYCGDERFTVELVCLHCDSSRLRMGVAIEHLECGYIGFEDEIKNMVCPKCKKRMRALGVDYRKPGVLYRCLSCKELSGEPRRKFTCLKEKHVFYDDESVSKELYSYRFNQEKRSFVESWVMNLTPVVDSLRAKGWYVESPARIKGRSGVEHTFTLLAFQDKADGNWNTSILIDVLVNDRPIDDSALSLIFKALDVDASKRIMIFVPGLTDKAKTLFDYYRVLQNMFILECRSIGKINDAILSVLDNMIEISPNTS